MLLNMPLKNVHDEIKMEQLYDVEKVDNNKKIGAEMRSLSFYEVTSMILRKK